MNQTGKGDARGALLAVIVSFVLYLTSIGQLFFTLPLLLLDRRYPKRTTDTACVAALVLILGRNIIYFRDVLNQGLTWAFIAVTMFMPLSLILSAIVWVTRGEEGNIFKRLIWSFLPSIGLFAVYEAAFLLLPDVASALQGTYAGTVAAIVTTIMGIEGQALEVMSSVILLALVSLTLPIVLVNSTVLTYIYEASTHAGSGEFECRVRTFRVPEWFLYLFLGLWALVLAAVLFTLPYGIVVPVLGLAISALLVYFMQGFAIAVFKIQERGSAMTSFRMATWLFLILLVAQGLNAILVFGISILGVLENWIIFRKPKEFST